MGNTVLITGGSSGIGSATAYKLASLGYKVLITYNNGLDKALLLKEKIKEELGVDIYLFHLDITLEDSIDKLVSDLTSKFNGVDVLINNAGIAIDKPLLLKEKSDFFAVLDTNLVGVFLLTKKIAKQMILNKKGTIINIASTNGIDTLYPESCDYDASKAGLISLTHNLAKELSPIIRVNAIAPGWIDTDMNKDLDIDFKNCELKKILLNRFGSALEVANVVAFLISEEASYVNDTIIRVDGGLK